MSDRISTTETHPKPAEGEDKASVPSVPFTTAQLDYQVTQDLVKMHTDIRFRLLAILPPIVAASVALVSAQTVGLSPFSMFAVGSMGFFLTLGLVLYDLRNSDLYNACVHRAKVLEGVMGFIRVGNEKSAPSRSLEAALLRGAAMIAKKPNTDAAAGLREVPWPGGAHRQRAVRYLKFLRWFPVSHGSALALVYGVLLGAWVFPIVKGLLVGAGSLLSIHYGKGTTSLLAWVLAAAGAYAFWRALSMTDVPGAVHGLYPEPRDDEDQQQKEFDRKAKDYAARKYNEKAGRRWTAILLATDGQSNRVVQESNRVVQISRFGDPGGLEVVDTPLPTTGRGEVGVRILASGLEYTDVLIRRHLYPRTMHRRPPFVLGYDVIGEIDQLGDGVSGFQLGDRVADLTILGSNAAYRTLRADHVTRVPADVDAAEAVALILSWTTAYQLLHRMARVQSGQRVLVRGADGAVGQALLELGKRVDDLKLTPIDYGQDLTHVEPNGFDVVFDGVPEDGYRRSFAALKPGGLLCAYGYSVGVLAQRRMLTMLMWIAQLYLWRWLPGGRRGRFYSIDAMRARHPAWFRDDLERLFGLLANRHIQPRVERIFFDEVVEAHHRLEVGGLDSKLKLVLCPGLFGPPAPSRQRDVPPASAIGAANQ